MLVITRFAGEKIKINDNITITILGINGRQVRVGIDAPRDIPVHREEIFELIQQDKGQQRKRRTNGNC